MIMSERTEEAALESEGVSLGTISIVVATIAILIVAGIGVVLVSGGPTGALSINVKDSAGDWKHVFVTFSKVEVQEALADNETGWHSLAIENSTLDLTSLVNVSALLASGRITVGDYTQIRIIVGSVAGVMMNGTMVSFKVPSGELKTTHPFEITTNGTKTLTIDIDLDHSITHEGNGWIFKPVLGAVMEA